MHSVLLDNRRLDSIMLFQKTPRSANQPVGGCGHRSRTGLLLRVAGGVTVTTTTAVTVGGAPSAPEQQQQQFVQTPPAEPQPLFEVQQQQQFVQTPPAGPQPLFEVQQQQQPAGGGFANGVFFVQSPAGGEGQLQQAVITNNDLRVTIDNYNNNSDGVSLSNLGNLGTGDQMVLTQGVTLEPPYAIPSGINMVAVPAFNNSHAGGTTRRRKRRHRSIKIYNVNNNNMGDWKRPRRLETRSASSAPESSGGGSTRRGAIRRFKKLRRRRQRSPSVDDSKYEYDSPGYEDDYSGYYTH